MVTSSTSDTDDRSYLFFDDATCNYQGEKDTEGLPHGNGSANWTSNLQIYVGEWQHGKMHGQGELRKKRFTYEGQLVNNQPHGFGVMNICPQGILYIGMWNEGKKEGLGKIIYIEKEEWYYGQFADDKENGHGRFIHYHHTMIYDGQWKDGKRHGQGKQYQWIECDAWTYDGEWMEGVRHGQGTQVCRLESYKGSFLNDHRHGQGHLTNFQTGKILQREWKENEIIKTPNDDSEKEEGHNNGLLTVIKLNDDSLYTSQWKNGKKEGQGMMRFADEDTTSTWRWWYHGQFVDDKEHGRGVYICADNCGIIIDAYDGQWKDGKHHGEGKHYDCGRSMYDGEWMTGVRQGQGAQVSEEELYEGSFVNDQRHGYGRRTDTKTGKTVEGVWREDEIDNKNGAEEHKVLWQDGSSILAKLDDGCLYLGQWKEGKIHNKGTLYYPNGNIYVGQFGDDGEPQGIGTYYYNPFAPLPSGVSRWHLGESTRMIDFVERTMKEDQHAIIHYRNGDVFEGITQHSFLCPSRGRLTSVADKCVYHGQWRDTEKYGSFIIYHDDGRKETADYGKYYYDSDH